MTVLAKTISLKDYVLKEEGYLVRLYDHISDDSLCLKLYGKFHPSVIYEEYQRSEKLDTMGIKVAKVLDLIRTEEGHLGLLMERVQGAKPLSSFLVSDPEYAGKTFLSELGALHSIKGEEESVTDISDYYLKVISETGWLKEKARNKITDFILDTKEVHFIHGSLNLSSLYLSPKKNYWTGFRNFFRGNSLYDLGDIYFLCRIAPEEVLEDNFHLKRAEIEAFLQEITKEVPEKEIQPFGVLKMLSLIGRYGPEPSMEDLIEEMLMNRLN